MRPYSELSSGTVIRSPGSEGHHELLLWVSRPKTATLLGVADLEALLSHRSPAKPPKGIHPRGLRNHPGILDYTD